MSPGKTTAPQEVGFLLVPGFPLVALSAATEPFRAANRLAGRNLYRWTLISPDGHPVASGGGMQIVADVAIRTSRRFDYLFVVAGLDVDRCRDPEVFAWLRRQTAQGTTIGALSTGTLLLARAGVLRGRCTIHWENQRQLLEEFPGLAVVGDLYCIEERQMTCGGGIAALDMMLSLIAAQHGAPLAAEVAEQFLHGRIRESTESQRMDRQWRYGVNDRRLLDAIKLMEEHLEDPLPTHDIADLLDCSQRQLERLFQRGFGQSPKVFYSELRLKAARHLLMHSALPLEEISRRTGFSSPSHMGRRLSQVFGTTPTALRQRPRR